MAASEFTDIFIGERPGLADPATHALAIDLATTDTDLTAQPSRAIVIGTAGAIKVDMLGGETGVLIPTPTGILPMRVTKIYKTANGTTAAGITVLW